MRKFVLALIVILAAFILIGCPGVTDPPADNPATDDNTTPTVSSDAALSGLTVTTGSIDYVYTTIESSYSLTVSNAVDSITIAPILSDSGANLTIDGVSLENISITIPISVGENTFTLVVTAEDGETTLSYSVAITRMDGSSPDNTAPVITLSGDNPLTVEVNTNFTEPGHSALDDVEGDLTSAVVITGSVDTSTVGAYTLNYNVSDTSGNVATEVSRTVNVMDALDPPTISLASGTYASAQTVSITHSEPGVRIRYTLDATRITDETIGALYTDPITISSNTTLIARAFKDNLIPSSEGYSWWYSGNYAIVSPSETNMVANGDFSDGLVLWKFYDHSNEGNGEASCDTSGEVFTAHITDGGYNDWHVEAHYEPRFTLEQNHYYQLDFKAWAADPRTIGVQLHEEGYDNNGDGSSYSEYFGRTINLTTSPQSFSYKMTMAEFTDSQASLRFNLGIEDADVYLDDIVLTEIVPTFLTTADIPDANLRAAFKDATGKSFTGVLGGITDMDLAALEEFEANEYGITNLKGLEYCTSLEDIMLDDNNISDISILSGLVNLDTVIMRDNIITDISALSTLANLERLKIEGNPLDISDLSVLTPNNFPNLNQLYISNYVIDDTDLIDLTTDLEALIVALEDFTQLTKLRLMEMHMTDAQFSTFYSRVLAPRLMDWEQFELGNSLLTDSSLPLINNLENIKDLELLENGISNTNSLNKLFQLELFSVRYNPIIDLAFLRILYDGGAFQNHYDWTSFDIDIRDCNLELWPGSPNRVVVDYLIDHGVRVDYEEGNQLVAITMDGSGTEIDPYIVNSIEDLQNIRFDLDSCYRLGKNLDFNDTGSYDSGEVDTSLVTGEGFLPLGDNDYRFEGNFDGDNYVISNLYINRPNDERIGLFGAADSSIGVFIKNLEIQNCNISGFSGVGTLVGRFADGMIINCSSSGTVNGDNVIGGLVGYLHDEAVINSSSSSTIVQSDDDYAGGLVGRITEATLNNCFATGNVSGTSSTGYSWFIGGLVGDAISDDDETRITVSDCYAVGEVTGACNVGGLIGRAGNVDISSCYSLGNVEQTGSAVHAGAGGLVGSGGNAGLTVEEGTLGNVTIERCYAKGNILNAGENAGGLVGIAGSLEIMNSYSTGNVGGTGYNFSGLVGQTAYGGNTTITGCYSVGAILNSYAGGLINSAFSQQNSYPSIGFLASVINSIAFNPSIPSGNRIVGSTNPSNSTIIITNCYASETMLVNGTTVTSTDSTSSNGADISVSEFNDTNSYNNDGTSPSLNWDFTSVWEIKSGADRPTLRGIGNDTGMGL